MAMEQLEKYNFGLKEANGTILKKTTDNVTQSKLCNQCDFASSWEGDFMRHLKTHGGEKSNKCSQCDFASAHKSTLKIHLKIHSGEKSNKCSQCDFASAHTSALKIHL